MRQRLADVVRTLALLVVCAGGAGIARADTLLYDNGPISTGAVSSNGVAAPAGTTWSELQPGQGVAGFSGATAPTFSNRLADDFTVPAGGWAISFIRFYAYQTGSGTTSPFDALNFRIWDGVPGQMGSNIVFGDTTTNRLGSTTFDDVYRIFRASAATNRPVMLLDTVPLALNLAAGTYWLDFQYHTANSGNGFTPEVTLVGQPGKPGADGRQSINGGPYNALVDNSVAQDVPFQIFGPSVAAVPEPAGLVLITTGALGLLGGYRRYCRRAA